MVFEGYGKNISRLFDFPSHLILTLTTITAKLNTYSSHFLIVRLGNSTFNALNDTLFRAFVIMNF